MFPWTSFTNGFPFTIACIIFILFLSSSALVSLCGNKNLGHAHTVQKSGPSSLVLESGWYQGKLPICDWCPSLYILDLVCGHVSASMGMSRLCTLLPKIATHWPPFDLEVNMPTFMVCSRKMDLGKKSVGLGSGVDCTWSRERGENKHFGSRASRGMLGSAHEGLS